MVLESYPGGVACSGEQATFRAVANGATSYSWYLGRDSVAGIFDLFQSDSLRDGDSLVCVLENGFGCRDTLETVAQIAPVPEVAWMSRPFKLGRGDSLVMHLGSFVAGTFYDWRVVRTENVTVLQDSGRTVDLLPGQSVPVRIELGLDRFAEPGRIGIEVRPTAGDCPGPADTIQVEMLPTDHPVLVPEVMTPNADGLNDSWLIGWQEGVDPNDYEMHLFNRAGARVALIRPIHPGWQPGALPDGVYYWTLYERGKDDPVQAGGLTIRRK